MRVGRRLQNIPSLRLLWPSLYLLESPEPYQNDSLKNYDVHLWPQMYTARASRWPRTTNRKKQRKNHIMGATTFGAASQFQTNFGAHLKRPRFDSPSPASADRPSRAPEPHWAAAASRLRIARVSCPHRRERKKHPLGPLVKATFGGGPAVFICRSVPVFSVEHEKLMRGIPCPLMLFRICRVCFTDLMREKHPCSINVSKAISANPWDCINTQPASVHPTGSNISVRVRVRKDLRCSMPVAWTLPYPTCQQRMPNVQTKSRFRCSKSTLDDCLQAGPSLCQFALIPPACFLRPIGR